MVKRKALGRGLNALIPKAGPKPGEGGILQLAVDLIEPSPDQPRKNFPEDSLRELADSIRLKGILQPLLVRSQGDSYVIVVGERRWRAAQLAGLSRVPAILQDTDDASALELALIENIHREDLNPLEEARAYKMLIDRLYLTQEQVAERVGRKRSTVANILRLLKLHPDAQRCLAEGSIDMGHARALLSLDDPFAQRETCREAVSRGLSVRQVEQRVRSLTRSSKRKGEPPRRSPFITDAERRLSGSLEAPVFIRSGKKGGKIEISFFSDEDLQRLFELLTREQ